MESGHSPSLCPASRDIGCESDPSSPSSRRVRRLHGGAVATLKAVKCPGPGASGQTLGPAAVPMDPCRCFSWGWSPTGAELGGHTHVPGVTPAAPMNKAWHICTRGRRWALGRKGHRGCRRQKPHACDAIRRKSWEWAGAGGWGAPGTVRTFRGEDNILKQDRGDGCTIW